MKRLAIAVCLALVAQLSALAATTRYISTTGSNSNTCAQSTVLGTAKLTFQGATGAVQCMGASDTLLVNDGTYTESGGVTGQDTSKIPAGVSGSPTTIKAIHPLAAIIRPTGGGAVIWFTNDWITLDGIEFDSTNDGGGGVIYPASASHWVVKNSKVHGGHGVTSSSSCIVNDTGGSGDGQVLNNEIYSCSTSSNQDHGVYLHNANILVDGNDIHDNGGYGVHLYCGGCGTISAPIVRNNKIHANGYSGILRSDGTGGLFYNNLVYGNGTAATVPGIWWFSTGGTDGIYNNTIYSNSGYCAILETSSNTFKNNICLSNGSGAINNTGAGNTCSNNFNVTSCGTTQGTTNPFTNASTGNFTLVAASGPIDAGVTIGSVTSDYAGVPRPQGAAYDEGAYEYLVTVNGTPPIEPFTYTYGSTLDGQNGGTAWSAGWVNLGSNALTVVASPSGSPDGTGAALSQYAGGGAYTAYYTRTFGNLSVGTISWYIRVSTCNPASNSFQSYLDENSNEQMGVRVSGGNFQIFDGSGAGWVTLGACTINVWHRIDMDFDNVGHANQFRAKLDSGTYSAYKTAAQGTYAVINGFEIYDPSLDAHSYYLDGIGVNVCTATQLLISAQPMASAVLGATLGTITASIYCADGATVVTTATDSITLAKHAATCTGMTLNTSTNPVAAVSGVATWTGTNMTVATGACRLDVTGGGYTAATTNSFTINAAGTTGVGRLRKR